jgi:hypothetical protein
LRSWLFRQQPAKQPWWNTFTGPIGVVFGALASNYRQWLNAA